MTNLTNPDAKSDALDRLGYCLAVELTGIEKMKTFETEKNSIPEGATHYANESDVDYFLWCKIDSEGKVWGLVDDEGLISTVQQIEKPRTKTEFVKCEFEQVYLAAKAVFNGEELFVGFVDHSGESTGEYSEAVDQQRAARNYQHLYIKVETEIDERQEFIDSAMGIHNSNNPRIIEHTFGAMFDSGIRKMEL